jgi:hypothetical protein
LTDDIVCGRGEETNYRESSTPAARFAEMVCDDNQAIRKFVDRRATARRHPRPITNKTRFGSASRTHLRLSLLVLRRAGSPFEWFALADRFARERMGTSESSKGSRCPNSSGLEQKAE